MTASVSDSLFQMLPARRPAYQRCLIAEEIAPLADLDIGDAVTCTNGVVWVTQTGDPNDYLLQEGEQFIALNTGQVLVQAIGGDACYRLRSLASASAGQRGSSKASGSRRRA